MAEQINPRVPANPYADRLNAQMALLSAPMREAAFRKQQQLGLLGLLSGDEALAQVGNAVMQQANVGRQREQAALDALQNRSDAWEASDAESRQRAHERGELARQQAEAQRQRDRERAEDQRALRAMMGANRSEPLLAVVGPNGEAVFVPRSQAVGMRPAPTGGGVPTEDERKAAGWVQQARFAYGQMAEAVQKRPSASQPSVREMAVGKVSPDAAYAMMSPERQAFTTAASSFSEAVLRAATGAGVNRDEALQKVQELTPRYGEAPAVTAGKARAAEMYLQALELRAGRALPTAPASNPAPRGLPRAVAAQRAGQGQQAPRVVNFADLPD